MDTGSTVLDTVRGTSTLAGDLYGVLILFLFAIILFVAMKNFDTRAVIVTVGFCCSVIGVLLFTIELISITILLIPLVILFVGIFYAIASQ